MNDIKLLSMKEMFHILGYDYIHMEKENFIDIKNKNVKIKSFNHALKKVEMKKILKIVRKKDDYVYELRSLNDKNIYLRATGDHSVFLPKKDKYEKMKNIIQEYVFLSDENVVCVKSIKTEEKSPILDIEVEDNENYFSNGILSHNTGGNALKFAASIRLDIRKKETLTDSKEPIGINSRVKVIKNKLAPAFRETHIDIIYGKGIDKISSLIDMAVKYDIIKKAGSWYSYCEIKLGQGKEKVKEHINKVEGLEKEIEEKVKKAIDEK